MRIVTATEAQKMYGLKQNDWIEVKLMKLLKPFRNTKGRVMGYEESDLLAHKSTILENLAKNRESRRVKAEARRLAKHRVVNTPRVSLEDIAARLDRIERYFQTPSLVAGHTSNHMFKYADIACNGEVKGGNHGL